MKHHTDSTAPTTLVTTTETVIATIPSFNAQAPYAPLEISGEFNITTGASTTAVVVRVRQGSIAGAIVGNADTVAVVASTSNDINFDKQDNVGSVNGYVVTAQQTGATTNGTVNSATVSAEDF